MTVIEHLLFFICPHDMPGGRSLTGHGRFFIGRHFLRARRLLRMTQERVIRVMFGNENVAAVVPRVDETHSQDPLQRSVEMFLVRMRSRTGFEVAEERGDVVASDGSRPCGRGEDVVAKRRDGDVEVFFELQGLLGDSSVDLHDVRKGDLLNGMAPGLGNEAPQAESMEKLADEVLAGNGQVRGF